VDFLKWITGESWIFLKINLFKEPKIFLTSSIRCLHTQKSNLVWYSLLKKKTNYENFGWLHFLWDKKIREIRNLFNSVISLDIRCK
jgi:hypothetical protein